MEYLQTKLDFHILLPVWDPLHPAPHHHETHPSTWQWCVCVRKVHNFITVDTNLYSTKNLITSQPITYYYKTVQRSYRTLAGP